MSISTTDFIAPFDPTGYTSITGAQLLQLVSGLMPFTGIGFNIVTIDSAPNVPQVPPANVTVKWQNYTWIRITASQAIPYIWNPAATPDATLLQWVSLASSAIGFGTITGSNIAGNTITDYNIASLSYSKLIGAPVGLPPSGAAGGVLSGVYPNPTIAAGAVTSAMIAIATIIGGDGTSTGNIGLNTITYQNIALATIQGGVGGTSNIAANTIAAGNMTPGTAGQTYQTNAGATAVALVSPMGLPASGVPFGRILQTVIVPLGTKQANTGNITGLTAAPNANTTGVTDSGLSSGVITPLSATSTIIIEVLMSVFTTGSTAHPFVGLYNVAIGSGATAPLAVAGAVATGSSWGTQMHMTYADSGAGGARTYHVGFGVDAGSMYLNSIDNVNVFYGKSQCVIKVTEYL